MLSLGVCFCAVWDCSSCLGDSRIPHQVVVGTTSGIRASQVSLGIFLEIRRLRDLIQWRSCVDLRSEVFVFLGSCVDLGRTQGALKESLVK